MQREGRTGLRAAPDVSQHSPMSLPRSIKGGTRTWALGEVGQTVGSNPAGSRRGAAQDWFCSVVGCGSSRWFSHWRRRQWHPTPVLLPGKSHGISPCKEHFEVKCLSSHIQLFCDPMDCSPPGSSVHGIFRQEYWSGLPVPSPGDLSDPGIEPRSPALQADSYTI